MPLSIRLPYDLDRRLEFLAHQTGRTKTFYILKALVERIDDLEDYYLAADVLERIREGKENSYSSAELRKDLGLDD
jgi:RHH-type transcriptional regulator, rel operon repressor / antitoxin RelB